MRNHLRRYVYIHIADWLYYRFIHAQESSRVLNVQSSVIEDFMQLTYASLPASLKKCKSREVPLTVLIAEQLKLLKAKIGHTYM
ncbi:MAG: hypothetical protein M1353_10765 [Nitrospirae bacterium]|nr:hypothetical protein [Nitrospirota bacterium]